MAEAGEIMKFDTTQSDPQFPKMADVQRIQALRECKAAAMGLRKMLERLGKNERAVHIALVEAALDQDLAAEAKRWEGAESQAKV